ncbi:MAG: iron chaperone [Bacteroidota bacterium]
MKTTPAAPQTIDEYIAGFPADVQKILQKIRMTIHEAAPEATEKISYQMPTFYLNGNLVHFAGFKEHIGFYPVPTGIEKFKKELSVYKQGKGSVQFPLDQPMPYDLITKIVRFRVKENLAKAKAKGQKK